MVLQRHMLKVEMSMYADTLIFKHLEAQIYIGMEKGAKRVSSSIVKLAQHHLKAGMAAKGRTSKGKLSKSIIAKTASTGLKTYARWDVEVKKNYALWIEYGNKAVTGLPYGNKGGRDYSKSKFKGYYYLTKALTDIKRDGFATKLVAIEIVKAILSTQSITKLRKIA